MNSLSDKSMNLPQEMLPVDLARQEDVAAFFGVTLRTLVGWVCGAEDCSNCRPR